MVTPATILDLSDIAEDVNYTLGIDSISYVHQDLKVSKWFISSGLSLQFQVIGNFKVALHMYGESSVSLETLRNWIVSCGSWMMDNTDTTCILVYCRRSDIKLRFLLRACGAKASCVLTEGNGEEDELLYVFSKKNRMQYEGKLTCKQ